MTDMAINATTIALNDQAAGAMICSLRAALASLAEDHVTLLANAGPPPADDAFAVLFHVPVTAAKIAASAAAGLAIATAYQALRGGLGDGPSRWADALELAANDRARRAQNENAYARGIVVDHGLA